MDGDTNEILSISNEEAKKEKFVKLLNNTGIVINKININKYKDV